MKPRHAAALALVGWYLMASADPSLPLSAWKNLGSFDTVTQCNESELHWYQHLNDIDHSWSAKGYPGLAQKSVSSLQCVETIDPRLAR
jgi:hypothetical protein